MLRKILLVLVIIQCSTFFVIYSTFAEEDNLSQPDMTDSEKNIALVGNFVPNEYGLKVLENIEKNNPEHIFFLGDLGYDTPENWFTFSDRLGKERISVVIGNHDREDAKKILEHYGLNREFYSIDYENIHFIILASDLDYTKNSEQIKFLEDDLVKANNNSKIKWKIVLIHKPMIYKDYYVKNDPGLTNGIALKEGLQPILDAYGVDMIISGHVHLYERSFPLKFNNVLTNNEKYTYINPEGAIHVIVGTAGADKHHNQYPQTFEDWAVVKNHPPKEHDSLTHFLKRNPKQNKSYAHTKEVPESKKAILHYRVLKKMDRYIALEIQLETGRHHQIRTQLLHIGSVIKGDLKYGASRSNKDGSISLHARKIKFIHPVSKEEIAITAPTPIDVIWNACC